MPPPTGRIITDKNDIFFLHFTELDDYYIGDLDDNYLSEVIQKRKEKVNLYKNTIPASMYIGSEPVSNIDLEDDISNKKTLKGLGASGGECTGEACVIMNESEMGNFEPGKILIAPYMNPGWSPLISMAKAIVADTGGVMSHGSIISREFGIPCIVSVKNATSIIKTGDQLYINGNKGVVKIIRE